MILNSNVAEVFTSGVSGTEQFKFSNSPIIFKILSDSLYSDKIGSIVRELASNARDAHVAAGKGDVPFEIHVPTTSNLFNANGCYFSVKDYGVGLSEEEIYNLYTVYGESNKRSSNDFIGGFGIGSKSPFAYTETFTIVSRYNGMKATYSAFINSDGFPSITKVFESPTDEENGVEVSFNVKKEDANLFSRAVSEQLSFFSPFPKVSNGFVPEKKNVVLSGKNWFITGRTGWYYGCDMRVLIADIPYIVSSKEIDNYVMRNHRLHINVPVGEVDLNASREALAYTERTKTALYKHIDKVKKEIIDSILDEIKDKSEYDKRCCVNAYYNSLEPSAFNEVSGYEELRKFAGVVRFSKEDLNDISKEIKCSVRWFNSRKWQMNVSNYVPSKELRFIFVPAKGSTLENIKDYLKRSNIEFACVIRYQKEEDIDFYKNIFGNPSDEYVIIDPTIYRNKVKKVVSSDVPYKMYNIEYNSPYYHFVSRAMSYKEKIEDVKETASESTFVLLTKGVDFLGGNNWSIEQVREFQTSLNTLHNNAPRSILANFGSIMLISETSYKKMKKHGLELTSFEDCMNYINTFYNKHLNFSAHLEDCKKFSYSVERVMRVFVRDFSKEECLKYSKKNILFGMAYRLHDILTSSDKTRLFSEYCHSVLDNSIENEYDNIIKSEPLLELICEKSFWENEIKKCVIRYLNLN